MAVKFTPADAGARDSSWTATQAALKSVKRRGDLLILSGAAALFALEMVLPESARDVRGMIIGAMLVLALIGGYVWFVTTHKRRIAASRLSCQRCGYVPHDTEIDEVAESHRCPHCAGEL
ncbi:MAG TPA: hypothetical protein VFL16_02455 [Steroidobacteraceae bacterium]|jgi:hypothetical protein|nr:hypothetical protein [Steroidobacteraceae bacterium]